MIRISCHGALRVLNSQRRGRGTDFMMRSSSPRVFLGYCLHVLAHAGCDAKTWHICLNKHLQLILTSGDKQRNKHFYLIQEAILSFSFTYLGLSLMCFFGVEVHVSEESEIQFDTVKPHVSSVAHK